MQTPYDKKKNYRMVINVLNKLNWAIKKDTDNLIEAYTSANVGLTWGSDMVTMLIDDNRILVNSLSNLDVVKNQAFFTFGKLRRNTRHLLNEIADEMNTAHNKGFGNMAASE